MVVQTEVNPLNNPQTANTANQFASTPATPWGQQGVVQQANAGNPVGTVKVNANGILELPYDQSFASNQLQAIDQANQSLLGIKQQEDQNSLQYQNDIRANEQQYAQAKLGTKNTNAAKGTLFSSKMATGAINDATAYANKGASIEAGNAAFQQNALIQRQAIQDSLNKQLSAMAQEYTDKLGADAGNLGYGQSKENQGGSVPANLQAGLQKSKTQTLAARSRTRELAAIARRTGKPADKRRAEHAKAAYDKLLKQYKAYKTKVSDYGG